MNPLTIDQCVEHINRRLTEEGLQASMNIRLLRHYQQQKAIPAPTQEGRFAKYSDEHVEAVVELRKAQDLGVSSRAYTTISNIEKHADPHATVASLGVNTPPWMANSLVGSVSSAGASTSALASFSSALETARTANQLEATQNNSAPVPDPNVDERRAALKALHGLDTMLLHPGPKSSIPAYVPDKLHTARTLSTMTRMVSASNTLPGPAAEAALTSKAPGYAAKFTRSQAMTKWTLDHDVCVEIPSATFGALHLDKIKAFEAWMAQMPDMS